MRSYLFIIPLLLLACGSEEITPQNELVQRNNERSSNSLANYIDEQGIKQGYWVLYGSDDPAKGYPADCKIEEGNYKDGQKDGEWIYYSTSMGVDSIVNHLKDSQRKIRLNLVCDKGKKQDYWIFYGLDFPTRGYADFARVEEGRFKDDLKVGSWTYYNENGRRDSVVKYESGRAIDIFIPDTTKYKRPL